MRKRNTVAVATFLLVAFLAACDMGTPPDWEALYSVRLGQPVLELDTSTLGKEYVGPASGALTRAAWVRLRGGTTAFWGLPPHGLGSEQVIERTVILTQQEWQRAYQQALEERESWGWEMNHTHPGSSIYIHSNNQRDAFCEFVFLPDGWELRTVRSQGILKPSHRP